VVGLGGTLALVAAVDTGGSCPSRFCPVGPNVGQGLLGLLAPVVSVTAAFAGYQLFGGDGGWLTAAVMMAPALLVGGGLLAIANQVSGTGTLELMPMLIASGAFLAAGSAAALHFRSRQLASLGAARAWGEASPGRVALTSLVGALATGPAVMVTALLIAATLGTGLAPVFGFLAASAGTVGVAAAAWGVHKGLDGRGSFLSALVGMLIGSTVIGGGTALLAAAQGSGTFDPTRTAASTLMFAELVAVTALFAPVIGLELSHTANIQAALPKFTVSAAPIHNGGMVGAAMRF
jgi:hypothetical protein